MKVQGQCHCGAIRYEAHVTPGTVAVCHCADCQRSSGSAFRANISAPAEGFRLVSGEPRKYVKTADSGAQRVHAFCGDCGSPVYSCATGTPSAYTLRLGALEQRHQLGGPARQIWTRRRFAWLPPLEGVPEADGQPPSP